MTIVCSVLLVHAGHRHPDLESRPTAVLHSALLENRFGHRTVTHSIIGGYWSHIQIDMANIRGVDLFWPSPIRVVMPGKIKYRMEIGGKAEMVVMVSLFIFCVGLYLLSGLGLRGGLHQVLKDFDIAYDEYVECRA